METSVFKINKMIWKVCSKWDSKCCKEYGEKARSEVILMVTGESVDHIHSLVIGQHKSHFNFSFIKKVGDFLSSQFALLN